MMIDKLKALIQRAEAWPVEVQNEALEALLSIEQGHIGDYELTPEDRAAIERSAEDVRTGRFATDEEVARAFARSRRA